ncbi:MAG: MoaD/ThiS family protein [Proteobacteria bacterium]|nr:MoaD/ThiS family protein [Pseudomonadota bacterium]
MIAINVKLFGAFRKYGDKASFTMPSGASVRDVKERLAQELKGVDPLLIDDSAIANDNDIVGADFVFTKDSDLAILPPVCGG